MMFWSGIDGILEVLTKTTPLGVVALLGLIIYILVQQRRLTTNHLSELPQIVESLRRIEESLMVVRDGVAYLKAKLDDHSG